MYRVFSILLASIVFTVGAHALRGTASATTVTGSVDIGNSDIWQFQCTSSLTTCIDVVVCDAVTSSPDVWWVTLDVYAPTSLLGKGLTTYPSPTSSCTTIAGVCRVPPSHGAMKALVNVSHIAGDSGSDTYRLIGTCRDTAGNDLPDSVTKLLLKSNH